MFRFLHLWLGAIIRLFRSRQDLLVENLALRQQLAVFKGRNRRPKLAVLECRWQRAGFRLYCGLISKVSKRVGRRRISNEVRDLIFRMVAENPTWGAPGIHGELLMLGFDVSERSISRWIKRAPEIQDWPGAGRPLFAIIAMPSLPWIFSPSQQSPSSCCTASLLLATIDGRFCT
jgi:hypothetical protein